MVLVRVASECGIFPVSSRPHRNQCRFQRFMADVEATGKIERVTITGQEISGIYRADKETFPHLRAQSIRRSRNQLIAKGILGQAKEPTQSPWAQLLYSWAPILLLIGFRIFFMRQMQSGGNKALSFGKSKAKLSSSAQKKVTFRDVAGAEEAKNELQEIIEFLKEPQKFQKLGGRIPRACC